MDALVSCAGVWVEGDSAAATEADWDRFAEAWVTAWNKHQARLSERVKEVA